MSSRRRWLSVLRWVGGGLLGYALIAILTSLGFSSWLGDPAFSQAPWQVQAKGALVALVAGLSGGTLAGRIGGLRPDQNALAVVPFLAADSIYVLFFLTPRRDPFLFDLAAALVLIGATLAGGWLVKHLSGQRPLRAAA